MVKLFFIGIGVFILAAGGAWAAVFTPLPTGVLRTLGGISQPTVATARGWLAQITPTMWLAVLFGLITLGLVYTVAALGKDLVGWGREQRRQKAERRWRVTVAAVREQISTSGVTRDEYEALWK